MVPAPLPEKEEAKVEEELDAVIDRIDECLPVIHAKVAASKTAGGEPASDSFNPKRIMQTKRVFQAMAADPLLSESGEDIKLD